MKYFSRNYLLTLFLLLAISVRPAQILAGEAAFKIELIPTIVWQGQPIHAAMVNQVSELHRSFPNLKIVHAVNPRLFMNGTQDVAKLQQHFGSMLKEGDGVAMHISRLREWMVFARLTPTSGENLYGIVSDNCDELCGMDQSFAGINSREFGIMIATGMSEMQRAGLGTPRIAIVEQGTLPETQWNVLADNGLKVDWSGFNLDAVANRLKSFPIYAWNDQARNAISAISGDAAMGRGRSLDHLRFGVWLEAADLGKIDAITDAAIVLAKSTGRAVKVPLLVNASTLVHYEALMTSGVARVFEKVGHARGTVVAWSGDDNSNWDVKKLGALAASAPIATSDTPANQKETQNSEVMMNTSGTAQVKEDVKSDTSEPAVEASGQKHALTTTDEKPVDNLPERVEDPQIVPSHAREMSH